MPYLAPTREVETEETSSTSHRRPDAERDTFPMYLFPIRQGSIAIYDPSEEAGVWQEEEEVSVIWAPIRALERFYTLRGSYEVGEFLWRHPFLVPLLLEARAEIEQVFSNAEVALQVIANPEEPDFEQLFAYVSAALDPIEALLRLRQFDDAWWLRASPRAAGKFCIYLELR